MVVCCTLVHNLLLERSTKQVKNLLEVLEQEGMVSNVNDDSKVDPYVPTPQNYDFERGNQK